VSGHVTLEALLASVRRRAAERRRRSPLARLERTVAQDLYRRERALDALAGPGCKLVAGCKRRSPATGALIAAAEGGAPGPPGALGRGEHRDWSERSAAYARGGAAALSIWTETDHFGGRLEDLRTVEHVPLARLRQDLVLDEGMVYETMSYGADMLVLLPAVLEAGRYRALATLARELGLAVWAEVHDEQGLERALEQGPEIVAAGARDPRTGALDPQRALRLLARVPGPAGSVRDGAPVRAVCGGLASADDLRRARDAGAGAARVGTALMRARDPEALLAAWRRALET
jgi:indole-3-glycerol phosphate synthase